jgi:hypothetical protein
MSDDPLVAAAIKRGEDNPRSWWITRLGTILINAPDVVIWIGGGKCGLKFGVAMPPVYGPEDIADIPVSSKDRDLLWSAFKRIEAMQIEDRRAKALASVGR